MRIARWLAVIATMLALAACSTTPAPAQSALLQAGPVTPGHVPMYLNSGTSQAVVQDGGPASGGGPGVGLGELGLTARGTGAAPYVAQGSGPLGSNFCDYDGPVTTAAGYHYLCMSPNTGTGGVIAYGASGGASPLPLIFNINGTAYPFPAILSGVVGPATSIIGDIACWNNTTGTLLSDCGLPNPGLSDNITATGNNQATAFPINNSINAFTVVGAGTGTVLPTLTPRAVPITAGYVVEVINAYSNPLLVYPPSGQSINGSTTNTAVTIFAGGDMRFIYRGLISSLGAWYAR